MWMNSLRNFTIDAAVASCLNSPSWLAFLLALGLTASSSGQEFRAGISGIVTDATGASVVGARVEVTDVQRKVKASTLTNDVGRYAIEFLLPSTYQLTIEAKGFKKYVQENFSLALMTGSGST